MPAIEETPGEQTMRRWYETRMADQAAQILHQAKQRRILNRLAVKGQNGTIGKEDPVADQFVGSDDMQVRIGDEVHHHHLASEFGRSESNMPAAQSGWLKKAAIAAALLGVGGGTGAFLPGALNALKPEAPTIEAPTTVIPPDKDSLFELHLPTKVE